MPKSSPHILASALKQALGCAAILSGPAFLVAIPGTAVAQAKYMGSSVDVVPGPKIGCPSGRRENLDNRVGLMPCVEDHNVANAPPRQPGHNFSTCGGGVVQWAFNGNLCRGSIGNGAHSSNGTAVSNNGNTGSAAFQCFDGTWYGPLSGTCVPPVSCPDTEVTWVGEDGTCMGMMSKSLAGTSAWAVNVRMVTNNRPGNQPDPDNRYSATCQSNGQWRATSYQCKVVPSGCRAETVYWNRDGQRGGEECYGPTTNAQSGQSVRVANQNPSPATGHPDNFSNWLCMDGAWSITTSQCMQRPREPEPLPESKTIPVYARLAFANPPPGYQYNMFCGFATVGRATGAEHHSNRYNDIVALDSFSSQAVNPICFSAAQAILGASGSGADCRVDGPYVGRLSSTAHTTFRGPNFASVSEAYLEGVCQDSGQGGGD